MTTKNEENDVAVPTKSQLRGQLFSTNKQRRKIVVNGVDMELLPASIGYIDTLSKNGEGVDVIINTLIDHAVWPGTDEKIFTIGDRDAIRNIELEAIREAIKVINEVFDLDGEIEETAKN